MSEADFWVLTLAPTGAFFHFYFWRRGHGPPGREFLLYHTPANLSSEKSKKNKKIFFPKKA
jgi:hypothetical protein